MPLQYSTRPDMGGHHKKIIRLGDLALGICPSLKQRTPSNAFQHETFKTKQYVWPTYTASTYSFLSYA